MQALMTHPLASLWEVAKPLVEEFAGGQPALTSLGNLSRVGS